MLGPNHYAFGIPGQYPPWYPPPMTLYPPAAPELAKRKTSPGTTLTISSDDSDTIALYPYHTIEEFLARAAQHRDAGERDFDTFRATFKEKGVQPLQRVHELKKMPSEQLESTFKLNWSDARFLHGRIKKSIRTTHTLREGERAVKRQRTR